MNLERIFFLSKRKYRARELLLNRFVFGKTSRVDLCVLHYATVSYIVTAAFVVA